MRGTNRANNNDETPSKIADIGLEQTGLEKSGEDIEIIERLLSKISKGFLILSLVAMEFLFAQPDTVWTKTFGGDDYEIGNSVKQTSDGGYVITGTTKSFGEGGSDVWLIKTGRNGDTLWTKTFGGFYFDGGNALNPTLDGGYVITGYTRSYGAGSNDVWLIRTDNTGDTLWTRMFGGSQSDAGNSVRETLDGGYVITGTTDSFGPENPPNVWLIKTDNNGNAIWTKTFGGSSGDYGQSVQQTSDGGYIIVGSTYSYGAGDSDVWLIKTDGDGNVLWTKTLGGNHRDWGYSIQETSDEGYVITGYTESYGQGGSDVWLIRTDASGDTLWTETFGGGSTDMGWSVQQTTDGGYVIAAGTESYGAGSTDVWLIKTDGHGNMLWTKTLGGIDDDRGNSIVQTSDGGYIIVGSTYSYGEGNSDVWLITLEDIVPPSVPVCVFR